ncbi:MAG: roadblock/LC7 domain-containing protein [Geobacteraceae bacterium]|nr:roadblock/LC7 domain-containing protein [Geobacteraceae bacterium]
MEEFLKQIKTVPGTLGCMVYDDQGQLVSHMFPSIFDQKMLSSAVTTVSENLPGLRDYTGGVRMIDFRFQNGRIVVKPVDGGCLVILCEGTVNLQSLIISLNLVVKQVEKSLKSVVPATQQAMAVPVAPPVTTVSPLDLIEKSPLASYLQGMQTTLSKFMGPMAKVIFVECVEKWLQDHQPVKTALPHLVDIVAAEIGDPAKTSEYRQKVSTFL